MASSRGTACRRDATAACSPPPRFSRNDNGHRDAEEIETKFPEIYTQGNIAFRSQQAFQLSVAQLHAAGEQGCSLPPPQDGPTARYAEGFSWACWGQPEAGTGRIRHPIIHFQAAECAWPMIHASSRGGTIGSSGSSF